MPSNLWWSVEIRLSLFNVKLCFKILPLDDGSLTLLLFRCVFVFVQYSNQKHTSWADLEFWGLIFHGHYKFSIGFNRELVGSAGVRNKLWAMAGEAKSALVARLLEAKKDSGMTYTEIAKKTGLTNAYVAQLFRRQAHLKPDTAKVLKSAVPSLSDDLIAAMQEIPLRSYDPTIVQDPTIYRWIFKVNRFDNQFCKSLHVCCWVAVTSSARRVF